MNAEALIDSLERYPEQLVTIVRGMSDEAVKWKPDKKHWSILEVVCHLRDEEMEDFRSRIDLIFNHPGKPWPAIGPEFWAEDRQYNQQDMGGALSQFCEERQKSIVFLRGLGAPDWTASHMHTRMGKIRTGDLLTSWAVHDQLHLRQIIKRRFQLLCHAAGDYQSGYAGKWGA